MLPRWRSLRRWLLGVRISRQRWVDRARSIRSRNDAERIARCRLRRFSLLRRTFVLAWHLERDRPVGRQIHVRYSPARKVRRWWTHRILVGFLDLDRLRLGTWKLRRLCRWLRRRRGGRRRTGCRGEYQDLVECRGARGGRGARQYHVTSRASQYSLESLPLRSFELQGDRCSRHSFAVDDLGAADPRPLGEDLTDRHVLGDQLHLPVVKLK